MLLVLVIMHIIALLFEWVFVLLFFNDYLFPMLLYALFFSQHIICIILIMAIRMIHIIRIINIIVIIYLFPSTYIKVVYASGFRITGRVNLQECIRADIVK
jgi:hypothetical protein